MLYDVINLKNEKITYLANYKHPEITENDTKPQVTMMPCKFLQIRESV